ncbi:glycosyltransferase family 4 protein [Kocuria tytonis]|uniref:Glycosyltransferase family 1 protein n=1 Tax=Kocuria tytonis TaxID=2054280 RepID=A0A495A8K8_9MICC|nr:glycosyltransferase family 1 protein [Kocuria tytonis]RKQ36369.1 glycosyltransferase family 1 protein [Kocuria tytonis]
MKLLFDARYIRTDHHDGISRYSAELLAATARAVRADPRVRLSALISDPAQRAFLPEGLTSITGPAVTSPAEVLTAQYVNRWAPDVMFSPMQTMGSLARRYRLILTLHDLIYYEHPQPPGDLPLPVQWGWRAYHRAWWPQRVALNRADAVATVSETSRAQILAHRLTRRDVRVIANAAPSAGVAHADAVSRLGARGTDLVYMGSFLPYKNVETLLRAAGLLPGYTLHLLSRITPAREAQLRALVPDGAHVVFHRGVGEDEYRELLSSCAALVTASRAEGYGLPLVEAFAQGAPVVCSDLPIFHEVAGDAAGYAPADDAAAFAARVRELTDPDLARERVRAGLDRIRAHTWQDSARELLELAWELHQRG